MSISLQEILTGISGRASESGDSEACPRFAGRLLEAVDDDGVGAVHSGGVEAGEVDAGGGF